MTRKEQAYVKRLEKRRRELFTGLAYIGLFLCAGCWNRVDVEDSRGNSDRVILPSGYHLVKPLLVKQNDSNMVVTITFERNEK